MTRAERLNALLKKALSGADPAKIDAGDWGAKCPYTFTTNADGSERLVVENYETGDRIGVVGANRDELLDKLDARLA